MNFGAAQLNKYWRNVDFKYKWVLWLNPTIKRLHSWLQSKTLASRTKRRWKLSSCRVIVKLKSAALKAAASDQIQLYQWLGWVCDACTRSYSCAALGWEGSYSRKRNPSFFAELRHSATAQSIPWCREKPETHSRKWGAKQLQLFPAAHIILE